MLLQNPLRLPVRQDASDATASLLSIAGAVNTQRYERRRSELAFIEDGVRLAVGEGVDDVTFDGWPSLRELLDDVNEMEMICLVCADCASSRGIDSSADSPLKAAEWVATEDVRLPLHECGKNKRREERALVTSEQQREEQRAFDAKVGRPTAGADRGAA